MAPLAFFVLIYLVTLILAARAVGPGHPAAAYWAFLAAAVAATVATIALPERGRWNLGLAAPPFVALRELAFGIGVAAVLLFIADAAILLTTELRHQRNDGFPWRELAIVFIPAVLHEELLFRGYVYQKLRRGTGWFAVVFMALAFAALHAGNAGVTRLALANIFVAGILIALVYDRYQRLWAPIGLHLAWNLISGPLLGYNVSGYASRTTILRTIGGGPPALTGGAFGIEGSALTLAVMVVATLLLGLSNMMRRPRVSTAGIDSKEPL